MRIAAAGFSDRGRVRADNDDHYVVGPFVEQGTLLALACDSESRAFRRYGLLVAVADGMGGYAGGGEASRLALETLTAQFHGDSREGCTPAELADALARYLAETQRALAGWLARHPHYAEAGTTLAGVALMPPDALVVFHIGDSRVLRAAAGFVRPLTVDHTPVGADLATGRLTAEQAAALPAAHQLTRSLGAYGDAHVEVSAEHTWAPGTHIIIGTDGWHGVGTGLPREAVQAIIRQGGDAEVLARTLVERAVEADGSDNATVVVVEVGG